MNNLAVFLIAVCVLVAPGIARKCYQCTSSVSWDSCNNQAQRVECLTSNECVKAVVVIKHAGYDDTGYVKACAKTCNANDIKACRDGHDDAGNPTKCQVNCCSSDYCNAGSPVVISSIVMAICAVAPLLVASRL